MFRFKCLFRLHVNKSIFFIHVVVVGWISVDAIPNRNQEKHLKNQMKAWQMKKLPLQRQNTGWPSIEDWEKIETNGFGGKCDATSSKNRGWLLTNERLCHLGQITQQINGKEKENIWKVGVSSEKRRILQNAQIAKLSKRFKTQSVSWKATENQIFSFFYKRPRPARRPMGIKKCKNLQLRWGILIQHHGYSVARLDRKLWFSMKNLYLYI